MHGSPHFPSFLPIASGQMNALLKIHSSLAESNTWPLLSSVPWISPTTLFELTHLPWTVAISALYPRCGTRTSTTTTSVWSRDTYAESNAATENSQLRSRFGAIQNPLLTALLAQASSLNVFSSGTSHHSCTHHRLKPSFPAYASMPDCLPSQISLSKRHTKLGNGG
jgi:hypothetical protein